jgi:hypothetical protein
MATIKYRDRNGVTHGIAHMLMAEARPDLIRWQYVCSRLLKVSDAAVPTEFRFMDYSNEGGNDAFSKFQNGLNQEILTRGSSNHAVPAEINALSRSPLLSVIDSLEHQQRALVLTIIWLVVQASRGSC